MTWPHGKHAWIYDRATDIETCSHCLSRWKSSDGTPPVSGCVSKGAADEQPAEDILATTPPEGIPGALFSKITQTLLAAYRPGTMNPVTATGAGTKAQNVAVLIIQDMTDYYEAVAAEDQ